MISLISHTSVFITIWNFTIIKPNFKYLTKNDQDLTFNLF